MPHRHVGSSGGVGSERPKTPKRGQSRWEPRVAHSCHRVEGARPKAKPPVLGEDEQRQQWHVSSDDRQCRGQPWWHSEGWNQTEQDPNKRWKWDYRNEPWQSSSQSPPKDSGGWSQYGTASDWKGGGWTGSQSSWTKNYTWSEAPAQPPTPMEAWSHYEERRSRERPSWDKAWQKTQAKRPNQALAEAGAASTGRQPCGGRERRMLQGRNRRE